MKPNHSSALGVLVLAAGKGERMQSETPKVLHPLAGRPIIYHVLRAVSSLKLSSLAIVVGHEAPAVHLKVQEFVQDSHWIKTPAFFTQKEQLGTGHAVFSGASFLKKHSAVLIVCGDTPLLTYDSLSSVVRFHQTENNAVTLLTARLSNPQNYGRILRSSSGEVLRIVEESEAGDGEKAITEVNSGVYCFSTGLLLKALKEVKPKGPHREYYLTDAVDWVRSHGGKVAALLSPNAEEILGINSRLHLSIAERILNRRTLERFMLVGVTVVDPAATYADSSVEIGAETVLYPGVILKGATRIGKNARIGPYTFIDDSQVGNSAEVRFSCLTSCRVGDAALVGPFAHLRNGAVIGPQARVGNFSEVKKSTLGKGAKVSHLSYIGDAQIGDNVNIGAGVITCNFDGVNKHPTVIEADAFIGSNVNLVAPVRIGKGALVGAGSTITEDVPEEKLALARALQVIKDKKTAGGSKKVAERLRR